MKTLLRNVIPLGLAVTLQAEAPAPNMHVLVYNFAELSDETVVRTMQETERIFRRAGVQLRWTHCPPLPGDGPAAVEPGFQDAPKFEVRLLSAPAAERLVRDPQAHGLALFNDEGQPSSTAYVFAHRAAQFVEGNESLYARMLSYLISHELGHLLLGMRSHSVAGVMHVPWRGEELKMVFQGSMCFHPTEMRRIRSRLREIGRVSKR